MSLSPFAFTSFFRVCLLIARREFEASANRLLLDLQRGAAGAASALRDLRGGVGASAAALSSLQLGMSRMQDEQRRAARESSERAAAALLRVEERAEGARLSAAQAAEDGRRLLAQQSALRDLLAGIERAQADRAGEASAAAGRLAEAVAAASLSAERARREQDALVEGVRELRERASSLSALVARSLGYQRRLEGALSARLFGRLERGAARFYGGSGAALVAAAIFGRKRLRAAAGPAAAVLGAAFGGELALDAVSFFIWNALARGRRERDGKSFFLRFCASRALQP